MTDDELNAEVARRVMDKCLHQDIANWRKSVYSDGDSYDSEITCNLCGQAPDSPPRYSSDISAAWQVVEKMRELGWYIELNQYFDDDGWQAFWDKPNDDSGVVGKRAKSAARAICESALIALTPPAEKGGKE